MSGNNIPAKDWPNFDRELELVQTAFYAGDEAGAAARLEELAEHGSAQAMTWAGYVYLYGKGVAEEKTLALKWFSRAAEAGDPEAMTWIGHMHAHGDGVVADRVAARQWYLRAAEAGYAYGQHCLASMLDEDGQSEAADRWLRKAAEQGHEPALQPDRERRASAMFNEKRYAEALPVLREAASAGSAWCHEMLGYLYWRGLGVEVDRDRSAQHYEAAYNGGRSSASNAIGRLHLKLGRPETALEWFRKDSHKPISSLYWQYRTLKEYPQLEQYPGETREFLRKAADAGHLFAKRDLAFRMISGREGLRMCLRGGREWFGLFPRLVGIAVKDSYDERLG